jgi:hypothetical protein
MALGCASAPRTESLQGDDIQFTAGQAAERLVASPFFAERSPASPKAAIATRRAEVIARLQLTEGERWYLVDKVAAAVPIESLRARNAAFVIPEERARAAAANDPLIAFPPDRRPTHVLSATVRAANRSEQSLHAAYYLIEYRIITIPQGELVWSDIVEFKRVAEGKTFD